MNFKDLIIVIDALERTASRNVMTEYLSVFLREVNENEIKIVCHLLLGRLGPLYDQTDFGMAEKMVIRSIAKVMNLKPETIYTRYKEMGDMGELVQSLVSEASSLPAQAGVKSYTVSEVYEKLKVLATASGSGSQEIKIDLLAHLLLFATPLEAKYIVRMVLGKMRLGFSDKTILDALAVMDSGDKQGRETLNWAYQVSPDIGLIAYLVKHYGVARIASHVRATVGVPLLPCLAQRLRSSQEMIDKMKKVVVEPKYDGTRVQIHYEKQVILKTFARSLEDTTLMFPELKEAIKHINATSVIIDCEAVAFDPETLKLLNFQATITRKRKYGVSDLSKTVPIKFFCFDLLYLNGESLIQKPLYERRKLLEGIISLNETLVVDPLIVTTSPEEIKAFHTRQLAGGLEGAMVKQYDGEYNPGRTGWNWVKFKEAEDTQGKLSDTVDGIVLGYYRGKGKRSTFGIGAFLMGIRDDKTNEITTVAKIGTGLTDEQWKEMKRRVDTDFSMEKPASYVVAESLYPDVWVLPSIVVEVAADEITKSPLHSSSYGLRFPRLVQFRDDKTIQQSTSKQELFEIQQASQ